MPNPFSLTMACIVLKLCSSDTLQYGRTDLKCLCYENSDFLLNPTDSLLLFIPVGICQCLEMFWVSPQGGWCASDIKRVETWVLLNNLKSSGHLLKKTFSTSNVSKALIRKPSAREITRSICPVEKDQ